MGIDGGLDGRQLIEIYILEIYIVLKMLSKSMLSKIQVQCLNATIAV